MPFQGYVRFPTIHQDLVVFVAEDDLWLVGTDGGRAERLTAGVAEVGSPHFSPDGAHLAFVGREEGPSEVYVMQGLGDEALRLTFHAASCTVLGWSPSGDEILYATNTGQFHHSSETIYAISPPGGPSRSLPFGLANAISYGPRGGVVLGRNIDEPAHWKRYRGGRVGHLWCDVNNDGSFRRLLNLNGNLANPCWVGERIYFISDHEGMGNIYSCTPEGVDIRRHTSPSDHHDFYARNLSTDGQRLVYHAGGDLYLFNPTSDSTRRIPVVLPSLRTQRSRKFVSASLYLDTYRLHPQGYAVALTTRGKAFSMSNWEGPVIQHGEPDGVRYRFLEWLNDGKRLVAVHDAPGQESLIVFNPEDASPPRTYPDIEFGRATSLTISPTEDIVAITNHRHELILVDLAEGTSHLVDKSDHKRIRGTTWSPEGGWLAYSFAFTAQRTAIKLFNLETGETHFATEPILEDSHPSFDPDGRYLYFIGSRLFNPVYDNLQFDLSFPRGEKPYAIMLRRDLRSPFIPEPKIPADNKEKEDAAKKAQNGSEENEKKENGHVNDNDEVPINNGKEDSTARYTPLAIDLDGITERIVPFPVSEGRYGSIYGIKGKVLFQSFPLESALQQQNDNHGPRGRIECYDLENYKVEWTIDGVSDFKISRDTKTLMYRGHLRLRVLKSSDKPKDNSERATRESGWLELNRAKVSVQPAAEWKQMFAEAWRLQREQFWTEDMSGIDWKAIYDQYAPLVERVSSRAELSDLFWEIQGELGTSHAYESAGDYRHNPRHYRQGFLGVDWAYDTEQDRYRITHIVKGDASDPKATSPLNSPGLNIAEGDAVLAINGQRLAANRGPQELLVNQAENEVQLTIESAESKETRVVTVKALWNERSARYREWVENNRRAVHALSGGRIGYIHIPDMKYQGFAEFHRGYLTEYDAQGLLIDVRWNGGGNVSGLLLEKLARKRIAYRFSRWSQPEAYPYESPRGPMVALTNEHAGSDGDKFSHSFKLMGLGPLIGMRTWGGVIGISPRHRLVDNTQTTQPEFANWFKDVGWDMENYGTEPDIEVDIAPQDYVNDRDPQLERAVQECLRLIEEYPVLEPEPGERPHRGR